MSEQLQRMRAAADAQLEAKLLELLSRPTSARGLTMSAFRLDLPSATRHDHIRAVLRRLVLNGRVEERDDHGITRFRLRASE